MAQTADASADGPSQERLKREAFTFLRRLSQLQPVILFMDDLHWADASATDLLGYVADRLDSVRVLIVAAYRPSALVVTNHPFLKIKPDLEAHGACQEITLGLLSHEEVHTYLGLKFPGHHFPPALLSLIHEKTEGNPLFMVDLVRNLESRGIIRQGGGGWVVEESIANIATNVPSSVRGMIERKIQSLGEDHRLVLAASVQGCEFDSAVAAEVLGMDAAAVEERLHYLERAHEFVRCDGDRDLPDRTPSERYRFRHGLYQNALYASLGAARRAELSKAVAEALLTHYTNDTVEISAELGLLFEAARDPMRAAHHFRMASEHAAARAASLEAVTLGQRGLKLVRSLPASAGRDGLELALCTAFGGAMIATRGFDSPETARVFTRAHELCPRCGDIQQRFAVAWGLACVHSVSGDAPEGFAMGEEMLRLAEESNDTGLRVAAHYALGDLFFWRPRYRESMHHFDQAIALYSQPDHHAIGHASIGYDPGVASAGLRAIASWYLGFPDQAVQRVAGAAQLARPLNSPICTVMIDFFSAIIHNLRREPDQALIFAERAVAFSREEGFEYFLAGSLVILGWAVALECQETEGIEKVREGVALNQSIGGKLERPYYLALLGESLARAGRQDEALAVVQEGIDLSRRVASQFHEPDLLCLKAKILSELGTPDFAEAEACLHAALCMARETGAKSLELRAALGLCQLQHRQGAPEQTSTLAAVAGWFTEGFDTIELRAARHLLAP